MASNLAASTPVAKRLTKEKAVKLQKRLQAAVFGVTVGRQGTKLEELVRLYDVDGDGVLDPRELTRLIRYDFKIGKHDVEASCTSAGAWSAAEAFVVVAKYVRRELRELAPSDRERFFAALHAVYRVGQADGERAYLRPSRG